jgi:hypothetical protein
MGVFQGIMMAQQQQTGCHSVHMPCLCRTVAQPVVVLRCVLGLLPCVVVAQLMLLAEAGVAGVVLVA